MRRIGAWTVAWLLFFAVLAQLSARTPAIPEPAIHNAIVAERIHLDGLSGRVALIGSSLIGRVPAHVVGDSTVNLGLSAYGAATGILLADRSGALPLTVIVETNELAVRPDFAYADSLLAAASGRWAPIRAARIEFRPSTQSIATIVRATEAARAWQPDEGRRLAEARAASVWLGAEVDSAGSRAAARWAAQRLRAWRAGGVRVLLVEVPTHAAYRDSPYARALREIVDEELPSSEFARAATGGRRWHTTDGRHLEPRDARELAAILGAAIR